MADDNGSQPAHEPQLTPVGEKSLPARCKASTLTYCPTMDLIALVTEDDELRVFRLNGQKVLGGSFKGDPYLDEDDGRGEIRALRWKTTGHLIAVACADNTIRVISAFSGKTVHHYPAYQPDGESTARPVVKVTCLGWGVNFTDSKATQRHLLEAAGQVSVEDLLSPDTHPSKAAALLKADLPRELALLDIESSLPKLSTLPATGSDDDVFSSRASIDAIFHSISKSTSDAVDVMLVGFDDGTVHLRIFDCFEIGSLQIGTSLGNGGPCQILRHSSHPLSSTHALLALAPEGSPSPLHLLTLDLRFITRSGRYLSLLAHKTTQLQNLLRYIGQVQKQIELEWKNAQELPARYMRSVTEDLQEKCHCDFVTAAYHLVVTGDCFEPLKEFLVDIVGERGHKRWEKAVSTGYENVRRLTHECLLPALERCEVLLSRLIGLSKFYKLSEVLGLETSDLNAIVETLDCLHLLAHRIIIHANEELVEFNSFSRWFRHEIDMQSAEPMSQTLEELMEKTDMIEYPQTLEYIRGALTKSKLRRYIQQLPMMGVARPPPTSSDKWAPTGHDRSFYDTFKKLLKQSETPDEAQPAELPKINDLTKRLGLQFERVFGQIALTQRRGILHRSPLTLHPDCDKDVIDIKMCCEDTEKSLCVIYIATRSAKKKHLLCFYRVELDSENGVSSTRKTSTGAFDLQGGEIRQVQFVEDNTVMVLWSKDNGASYLLSLPFQAASPAKPDLAPFSVDYGIHDPRSPDPVTSATSVDLSSPDSPYTDLIKHSFPSDKGKARPIRIDVNGRRGRRAICVVYGDAMRYEVLDLDAELEEEEEEEQEDEFEDLE
ncbi:anaphase-promoting complex component Cut20/Apc4 [Aspergillus heteromorphus CBS 117.55]|uniref:Anaphase-promoting complex subunit 4 n=1 Tax=Aspergillus heteromorphus CBS 117.55 TaxID=1448321 RepID=A0A317WUM9_9EURO|nr:anaphase-promoting complex component Cut20/Apc4 [Aspergillus heteromorphus CBS 117.55]PWY90049.1 anaphase-promoting complex component Cut20/Apc4 [Aspergillus heteromorphus CBS 117.55]